MFKTDFEALKRIDELREMEFYNTAKVYAAQAKSLNVVLLSNEFKGAYQLAEKFNNSAFLEINHIDSLKKLERVGAKITMMDNRGAFDLDACGENQTVKCLVYIKNTQYNSHVPFCLLFLGFYFNNYYFYKHQFNLTYSDILQDHVDTTDYYCLNWGYGDFFMLLPLLYSLNKQLHIKFLTDRENIYRILCDVGFKDISELAYMPADLVYHIQNQNKHHNLKSIHNAYTYEIFSREQGGFETLCEYYKQLGLLTDLSCEDVFLNFKRCFPYRWGKPRHKRPKIAVQRLSHSADAFGNYEKEWPKSEMRRLIAYCQSNDIECINVCPHDEMKDEYQFDESSKNLLDLFSYLCNIDLFIGIDSAIGHMCGLSGTPSLSLYFSDCILNKHNFKFMPLSMNYTLFTKRNQLKPNNEIREINNMLSENYPRAEDVIKEMNNILSGKRKLDPEFVPLIKRREHVHYENVLGK